ncbi:MULTISPECIES: metallophosphoesterase [unclassified Flavobacterium]|uniref:metallophosphoesterase family protein n=1 Tax=unclassified Flavobacterium TaxID=196869 RepID=UPI000F0C2CAD|nr:MULTISPECIES: metallophosphoesterase family protein [unclassified Flavobacterium]AYN04158.1 metallophosphoesterase [Flavobacterium sp. 140616W15]MCD0475500.1 metallophosphatase family protein [Flavobacterium sp. EDS]
MKNIAIISDIHGNLPALKVVLEDIKQRNIDEIYCLGDLVDFAPWHNEVIEQIKELEIPCLMGNHDERIAFDYEVTPLPKHNPEERAARVNGINYTKQSIKPENKEFLKTLPERFLLNFTISGENRKVLLVHASTRSNDEYIYENHDLKDVQSMLAEEKADIIIMGHTHRPYIRPVEATKDSPAGILINCGSVGRSRENSPLATYLILHIDEEKIIPEIVKLEYPVNEVIKAIEKSPIPNFYAEFLKKDLAI